MRTKAYLKPMLFMSAFFLAIVSTAMGRTIFVDADATGSNDGSSWANAYNHLQDALSAASKIYWTDSATEKIHRANLDGSEIEGILTLTSGTNPGRMALDCAGGKMYWVTLGCEGNPRRVQRANLDGGELEDLVNSFDCGFHTEDIVLDLNNRRMYWTFRRNILSANLDGTEVTELIKLNRGEIINGIALDFTARKMYWTTNQSRKIQRSNLDGSGIEDLITIGLSLGSLQDIAVDAIGGKMYWLDRGDWEVRDDARIRRANLDGSSVEDLLLGLGSPYSIALDVTNGKMYWTDFYTNMIQRSNLDGSEVENLIIKTDRSTLRGIALYIQVPETKQYYVNAFNGNDNYDGLSPDTAFATIQRAIDAAGYGDIVLVYPGVYTEEIVFLGKAITIQGIATADGVPVLQNHDDFAVSFYYGEGPDSILKNFVIRNSFMAIFIACSSPTITNVTIVNNKYGIEAYAGAEPDISNCIFWNNAGSDLFGCLAAYSWVQDEIELESLEGLTSYWGFNEDTGNVAFDPIGGNHGTIYGGASRTEGISGGAFQFDGVDDYVDCGFSSSFCLLDDVSVTFWIKRQHQTKGTVLAIEGSPIDKGSEEDNSIFFLRIYTPQEVFEYIHEYGAGYNQTYHFQPIPYNEWTHVVVTRDSRARTVNAYFDGKNIGTFNYWRQAENPSEELDLVIGARSTGIDNYAGLLDEVALFDRVLSPQEIQMSYTLGLTGGSLDSYITRDPFFVDPNNGDYHLRSERGRYWPAHNVWVLDNITSPCIDGGNPTVDPSGEPMPNGGRINMGAYGGTAYASMSEMVWLDGDINHDGIVDMIDFAILADNWLRVE